MKKDWYIFLGVFGIGIVFRLFIIIWYPQPFAFDQTEYDRFAMHILHNGVYAQSARLYGYPLIVAIIYALFGVQNFQAVYLFQGVLDGVIAIILYHWAKVLFKQKYIPWMAFVLYIFNPYTSAYAGVLLSEVTGIFFTALLLYLFTLFWLKKKYWVFLVFCFIAGFLPQIRPAFLYFSSGLFMLCLYRCWKKSWTIIGILLFILPFLYVLWGNIRYFGEWKLTNVDRIFPRELYISIIVPNRLSDDVRLGRTAFPNEVTQLYEKYSTVPKNQQERTAMGHVYFVRSINRIYQNPWLFIRERLNKIFFVWEKHFLLYYKGNPSVFQTMLIYWGNILLLLFGCSGLILWAVKQKTLLAGVYVSFIAYISLIHSISLAEERYSLPGYPLLILFGAYALSFLNRRAITPKSE